MQKFATELYGDEYTVGTETEMDDALREYVEDMVDTEGYDGFASWVKDNAVNEDEILNWFDDYFNQDVYQEPDAYLDDSQRQLDSKQVETIKIIDARVLQTQREIERLEKIKYGIDDEDKVDKIDDRISQLEDYITELEEQKEEIEENPEGDFSDDDIENMIESKLDEVRYNPTGYAEDYGLELDDFIDKEKFIDTVIDNESYDMMSHNDGAVHEETVQGETYYIIKL
jgi:vacuolar-type H+-ATPase subunit I/STV1